jgi:Flp pilus assembly protein TadG
MRIRNPHFNKDERGAITVEMAVIATAVFFMVPIMMDLTALISGSMILASSVRAGDTIALAQPSNTSAIGEAIAQASGLPTSSVIVGTSTFCECDTVSTLCSTTTCPGGGTPATYMTISAQYTVPTILEYPTPNPFTLTKSNTLRVR